MWNTLRDRFGAPGIIALLALVLAMSGGAYAASGALTGKQKKEVKKIAQQYAGKNGQNGAPGANGQAGAKGDSGAQGAKGDPGASGAPGQGVTSKALAIGNAKCPNGGTEFTSGTGSSVACNGEEGSEGPAGAEGSPWTTGGVLPPEKAETGTWIAGQLPTVLDEGGEALETSAVLAAPISFTIPLKEAGEVTEPNPGEEIVNEFPVSYVHPGETGPADKCESGTSEEPKAAPGNLCVYATSEFESTLVAEVNPETEQFEKGTGKSGVILRFFMSVPGAQAYGSWIVRARAE